MNGMKQIFGKEMDRIFKDKKMVFSVFVLPVIIMIAILSIVNKLGNNMVDDIESHVSVVSIVNEPANFQPFLKQSEVKVKTEAITDQGAIKNAKDAVLTGDVDLLIEFPAGFETMVAEYKEGDVVPQIKTYYNPSETYSSAAYDVISSGLLEGYRQMLLSDRVGDLNQISIFTVNSDNSEMIIQDADKANGKTVGKMLPYFITILIFAGAMGIGTDMIAGEKERGTMASLLVSPVKRSSIVLGKVFSLMTISGISSLIYVIAMVVCMPRVMGVADGGAGGFDMNLSIQQIIMLGTLLILISFLYSAIIALVSVFAKSTKEASTYAMPVYMLVLVVGLLTMFQTGAADSSNYYIPIYNTALTLQGILSQEVTIWQYGVTVVETLVLGIVMTGVIVKAFESEKVMAS